ncbi:MAG: hypothetical protein J1F35_08175 [Erysipelotrichales bacterium]|nr:hypothetical protein [Erysipelotrichales bacterium]
MNNIFNYAEKLGYNGSGDLFELHQWLYENDILCLVSSANEKAGLIDYHVKIYPKFHKDGSENLYHIEKIVFKDTYKEAFKEALYEGLDCIKYYRIGPSEAFKDVSWTTPK